jgi:predicted small lipoprotein YifL
MRKRVPILLTLLVIGVGLAACGARRTDVYLWPPAADVADP